MTPVEDEKQVSARPRQNLMEIVEADHENNNWDGGHRSVVRPKSGGRNFG